MPQKKSKIRTPKTAPRDEFNRVLGNLLSADPVKREDAKTGAKKKEARLIPPKPQDSEQQ